MHPSIRIVTLLVLALLLSRGGTADVLLGGGLVVAGHLFFHARHLGTLAGMVRRVRWLLLSLLIAYLWFTPGEPLWPGLGDWAPTREGLQLGGLRVGLLLVLIGAVNLLLALTDRESLLAGLLWLLRPLEAIGLPGERLAVRTVLVMETVQTVRTWLSREKNRSLSGGPVSRIGKMAALLFQGAVSRAESESCQPVTIPLVGPPPWYQWFYPLVLGAALAILS